MYYATINGVTIGQYIAKADTFFSRLNGLMFQPKLRQGHGLWLVPCTQIHTCFMKMPIDVVYLSGNGVVLGIEKNLHPWKVGKKIKGTQSVLELASDTIEMYNIKVEQIIIFVKNEQSNDK